MKKRVFLISIISILLFTSGLFIYNYNELNNQGIVVLLYHKVKEKTDNNKYTLDIKDFDEQLNYLKMNGYNTILPTDTIFKIPMEKYNKTIILTFDDGTDDHYSNVFPLLRKYNYTGIFFIVTKYIGSPGCVTIEQISEMDSSGMRIGSHSFSHPLLDAVDQNELYLQLAKSKEVLDSLCITSVVDLAPPGGWFNNNVVTTAKKIGYKRIFSCNIAPTDISQNPVVYNRIEVLGGISLDEFKELLHPQDLEIYKFEQSLKFIIHYIVGSNNYQKWF